jgi:integrase
MSTSILVALSLTELRNLLAKTREHDDRCYVMFLLITLHGLRVSEAIELRRRNFATSGGGMVLDRPAAQRFEKDNSKAHREY